MTTTELIAAVRAGEITETSAIEEMQLQLIATQTRLDKAQAYSKTKASKPFTVEIGEYKGCKTLRFTGDFRPFALGLGKLRTIVKFIDEVRKAIDNHDKMAA